ncbi:cytochrome c biogenesis protein ResB [Microbacterium aurum]
MVSMMFSFEMNLTPYTDHLIPPFSAIYLLLFASLIGCVIPRIRHHLTALLAPPPATPRNLSRLPAHTRRVLPDTPPGAVLDAAEKALRRQRYRTRRVRGDGSTLTGLPAGQAGALIADTDLRTGITPAVLIGQGVSAVTLWGGLGGLALTGAIAWRRRTPAVA